MFQGQWSSGMGPLVVFWPLADLATGRLCRWKKCSQLADLCAVGGSVGTADFPGHVSPKIVFLGSGPPALPHLRKAGDSEHRFLGARGRWGSCYGGPRYRTVQGGLRGHLRGVGSPRRSQLVASSRPLVGFQPVGGSGWWLGGTEKNTKDLFGDGSADFLYGGEFMGLYVKRHFP